MDDAGAQKIYEELEKNIEPIRIGKKVSNLPFANGIGKCFSCSHAMITRTKRNNDPRIFCNRMDGTYYDTATSGRVGVVPHDIIECNRYKKEGELEIWDLIKMHNPVDLSKPERVAGFTHENPETPEL